MRTEQEVWVSVRARLEKHSMPIGECGCLVFLGYCDPAGYGHIALDKKRRMLAHRASFIAFRGPIPEGMDILHQCDVPACINPHHLFCGTHAENMADMAKKGRSARMVGERHPNARLTKEDIKTIRQSPDTHVAVAKQFAISVRSVCDIRKGKSWTHINATHSSYRPRLGKYGYFGVSKTNPTAKSSFFAQFRGQYLGTFPTAEDAARAFDAASIAAGQMARLNFPNGTDTGNARMRDASGA